MDPPLVNEASFTAAAHPSSYSLAGLLSFPTSGGGLGLRIGNLGRMVGDGSLEESTVTEQSGSGNGGAKRTRDVGSSFDDSSSKLASTSSAIHDVINGEQLVEKELEAKIQGFRLHPSTFHNESNAKRTKASESSDQNGGSKAEAETNSGTSVKPAMEKSKSEPPKDYIHVRARRGQATDSHSLAERARREKISERMKILQDLVPGCNKVIGKALVLDEIINYIQSLQRQVEFLAMKLEAVNSRLNPAIDGLPSKDLPAPSFDANGMIYGLNTIAEYSRGSQAEWLHMQVGTCYDERPT